MRVRFVEKVGVGAVVAVAAAVVLAYSLWGAAVLSHAGGGGLSQNGGEELSANL